MNELRMSFLTEASTLAVSKISKTSLTNPTEVIYKETAICFFNENKINNNFYNIRGEL